MQIKFGLPIIKLDTQREYEDFYNIGSKANAALAVYNRDNIEGLTDSDGFVVTLTGRQIDLLRKVWLELPFPDEND